MDLAAIFEIKAEYDEVTHVDGIQQNSAVKAESLELGDVIVVT